MFLPFPQDFKETTIMPTLYSDSLAWKLSNWTLDLILTTFFHSFHILTFKLHRIISVFLLGVLLPLLRKSTFLPKMAFSSVLTFYSWCEHRVWSKKLGLILTCQTWNVGQCAHASIFSYIALELEYLPGT